MITPPGLPPGCPQWFARPAARAWTCASAFARARAFHAGLPGYSPTPLTEVPVIASELGVGRVFVKDESARMGLAAFKVLGASWAVHQVLSRRSAASPVTLVAATDGNHGRALAWMARLLGQRAHVFVPSGVHPTAVAAIAAEGAQVTEITGSYDDAIRLAAKAAERTGGRTRPGRRLARLPAGPRLDRRRLLDPVRRGRRAARGGRSGRPGLVAIPAGVGSLAQAGITHYRSRARSGATSLLTVEPGTAACVLASLVRGELAPSRPARPSWRG